MPRAPPRPEVTELDLPTAFTQKILKSEISEKEEGEKEHFDTICGKMTQEVRLSVLFGYMYVIKSENGKDVQHL